MKKISNLIKQKNIFLFSNNKKSITSQSKMTIFNSLKTFQLKSLHAQSNRKFFSNINRNEDDYMFSTSDITTQPNSELGEEIKRIIDFEKVNKQTINEIKENETNLANEAKEEKIVFPKEFYNRNFKNLIIDSYNASVFLNAFFSKSMINLFCDAFMKYAIKTRNIDNNEKKLINEFSFLLKNSKRFKKYEKRLDEESFTKVCNQISQRVYISLITIYEFLDRGMRGFLTGDITLMLIKNLEGILEAKLKEIKEEETEFTDHGVDSNDFYEAYFKVDLNYFQSNSSANIVLNLGKHLEGEGLFSKKVLYYVNLKHIQLCSKYSSSLNKNKNSSYTMEIVESMINKKKLKLQSIFNGIYNEIADTCIFTELKTPFNGILYPHNESKSNLFRRQLLLEENSFDSANEDFIKIFSCLQDMDMAHNLFFNRKLILNWHDNLVFAINEAQRSLIIKDDLMKKNNDYMKYLVILKAEEISIICLLFLMKTIINNLAVRKVNNEETLLKVLNNTTTAEDVLEEDFELSIPLVSFATDIGALYFQELRNTKITNYFTNEKAKVFYKHLSFNMMQFEVDKKEKIKLGLFLTNIMANHIYFNNKYDENEIEVNSKLELIHINQKQIDSFKKQNFVVINKIFMARYYEGMQKTFSQNIQIKRSLPMIYPPMPWKTSQIGGYYLRQTSFSKVFSEHIEAKNSYNNCDINVVMKALDQLGSIGWRINQKVLDLVEYTWANGGGVASIPPRFNENFIDKESIKNKSFNQKLELLKESQSNREMHSLRCDFNIKLRIAKDYSKVREFYFPHNIDYRGRCYPISPHLNHIGNDLCRGMLEYSDSKPLGEEGLRWLKIHLANVIGNDKLPLDGRAEYIDSIIDIVHKCAEDPYNNDWWHDVDNPWQTIAVMFELSAALKVSNIYLLYSLKIPKLIKQIFTVM